MSIANVIAELLPAWRGPSVTSEEVRKGVPPAGNFSEYSLEQGISGGGVGWAHDPGSRISDQSTYPQERRRDVRLDKERGWNETNALPETETE